MIYVARELYVTLWKCNQRKVSGTKSHTVTQSALLVRVWKNRNEWTLRDCSRCGENWSGSWIGVKFELVDDFPEDRFWFVKVFQLPIPVFWQFTKRFRFAFTIWQELFAPTSSLGSWRFRKSILRLSILVFDDFVQFVVLCFQAKDLLRMSISVFENFAKLFRFSTCQKVIRGV